MERCRECKHEVSAEAMACPGCGAPYPAKEKWNGWGYEYKSKTSLFGLPLLHVSFKYSPNRVPVPAKGIFAVGQFACGIVTVSQFGLGVVSLSQFTISGFALTQIGAAYSLIAQVGVYVNQGSGQVVKSLSEFLSMF